jgi:hypothetical protein
MTSRRIDVLLLLVVGCICQPSNAFVIPNNGKNNRAFASFKSSSCLSVAVLPSIHPANSTSDDNNNNNRQPSQYANLQEANRALDTLAVKCGSSSAAAAHQVESVISLADECQSQWENMRLTLVQPDTKSLNLVLKAWGKCCQSLADSKKQQLNAVVVSTTTTTTTTATSNNNNNNNKNQGTTTTTDMGVGVHNDHPPVYTAKDAAERATLLLLSQEQDYQHKVLPESARPDVYSYNEVIGTYDVLYIQYLL